MQVGQTDDFTLNGVVSGLTQILCVSGCQKLPPGSTITTSVDGGEISHTVQL